MENLTNISDDDSDGPLCHSSKKGKFMIDSDSSGPEDINGANRTLQNISEKRKSKLMAPKLDYGQISTSDNDTHSEDDTTLPAPHKTDPENDYDTSELQYSTSQSPSEASDVDSVQGDRLVSDNHESDDGYTMSSDSDIIKNKGINQQNYHYDGESANQPDNASLTPSLHSKRRSKRIARIEKDKIKEVTALKERLQNKKTKSPKSGICIISDSEDTDDNGSNTDNSPTIENILNKSNDHTYDTDGREASPEEANEVSEHQARKQPSELTTFREKVKSRQQSLKNCFYIYIQYIASVAINDKFADDVTAKNDSYFLIPKTRIERNINTKISALHSMALQSNFKASLEKYPKMITKRLRGKLNCEACKLPDRIATWKIKFTRVAYCSDTYKQQEKEDGEPSKKSFVLGKFCKERYTIYHELYHYKFKLRNTITSKINSQRGESDCTVVKTIINDYDFMDQLYGKYRKLFD
ncbi:Uncharacterized protein C17H9.06c [Trichoplax sp. H2]|nr:Uncharacterized protein C17H9.06c [Trichoplax sp. H2]|eukprot:RDD43225.1 Uncharacterized protein C17H9.06c [Trichoplax sp. H2]